MEDGMSGQGELEIYILRKKSCFNSLHRALEGVSCIVYMRTTYRVKPSANWQVVSSSFFLD